MKSVIEEMVKELSILEVKPNQALFIGMKEILQPQEADSLRESLSEYLGCKVILYHPDGITDIKVIDIETEEK